MGNNAKQITAAIIIFVVFWGALFILNRHLGKNSSAFINSSQTAPSNTTSLPSSANQTSATTTPASVILSNSPKTQVSLPTASSAPAIINSQSPTKLLSGMHQTFDDEFNTFSEYLDSTGNTTCNQGGSGIWQTVYDFCSRTISTNYEAEVYIDSSFLSYFNSTHQTSTQTQSPFSINNGILNIEAAPIDPQVALAVGSWAKFTSGLITSQFSFSQEYGYFEMRAKLPAGKGLWPAFWLLPASKQWPPEIDAMEAFGDPNPQGDGSATTIHYQSISTDQTKSCGGWHNIGQNITQGFHTYGVDVEPTGITYYFDGLAYAQCPANPQANQPFYMLIDLAVGSSQSWPGSPDASNNWPAFLNVDYVRAYQNN
jgi:beta-glucanase (GH16 family)